MQKIEQLLTNWLALTLENPLYASVLILTAWILTSIFYHFRMHFLKKEQRKFEEAGHKIQGLLDEAQQLSKENTEKVTVISEQMEEEQKSALTLSAQIEERNNQVVESIKKIAGQFNLSEQLVASGEKPKPEFIWQQQDNIQIQLADALQRERDEKTTLQASLDVQVGNTAQLEKDLNAERSAKHMQTGEVDQKLIELLSEHEKNVSSLINGINDKVDSLAVDISQKTPLDHIVSSDLQVESSIVRPETSTDSDFELAIHVLDTELKTGSELKPEIIIEESSGVDKQPEQEVIEPATEDAPPSYSVEELNAQFDKVEPEENEKNLPQENDTIQESVSQGDSSTENKQSRFSKEKMKSLFGKGKKNLDKGEPEKNKKDLPQENDTIQEPVSQGNSATENKQSRFSKEKMKSVFGKGKKSLDKGDISQPTITTPELESVESDKKMNWGKEQLTGLLSHRKKITDKGSKEVKVVAPENMTPQEQEEKDVSKVAIQPRETPAVLRQAEHNTEENYEPDYAESNLHLFEKIKSLFGK